jgi:hypothetical protein
VQSFHVRCAGREVRGALAARRVLRLNLNITSGGGPRQPQPFRGFRPPMVPPERDAGGVRAVPGRPDAHRAGVGSLGGVP